MHTAGSLDPLTQIGFAITYESTHVGDGDHRQRVSNIFQFPVFWEGLVDQLMYRMEWSTVRLTFAPVLKSYWGL